MLAPLRLPSHFHWILTGPPFRYSYEPDQPTSMGGDL